MKPVIKLEVLFGDSIYVFRESECAGLLAGLDAIPEVGPAAGTLREDLRKALRGDAPAVALPNPVDEDTEEDFDAKPQAAEVVRRMPVLKNVAADNSAACGDCRIPRCRFCDRPGVRAGGRKDAAGRMIERYYICKTPNCLASRLGTPQPLELFAGRN